MDNQYPAVLVDRLPPTSSPSRLKPQRRPGGRVLDAEVEVCTRAQRATRVEQRGGMKLGRAAFILGGAYHVRS